MEITVDSIAMIRENYNPKNSNLNLDIDWSVDYTNTDQRDINYDIILKSIKSFNLNFKLSGFIRLGEFEEFIQNECSQIIFHHACTLLMNMISLTRQSNHELLTEDMADTVNLNAAS